jgi:pyruvate kinase
MPILVLTSSPEVARQVSGLCRGCKVVVIGSMIGSDSILNRAAEIGKDLNYVKKNDSIVAVHGMREAVSGATNMLKVLVVS